MLEKIYSRPRIKIKSLRKRSKKEKIKLIIYIMLVVLFLFAAFVIKAAYPIFIATCENAAMSNATNILNKEVNEVMLVYNYNDLVNLGKDSNRKYILY